MTSLRKTLFVVAVAVTLGLTACGPKVGTADGLNGPSGPAAFASSAVAAAGKGGDAWCQSIVTMTDFMAETDSFRALAGTPVADGPARAQKLKSLVADMEAKAPAGHAADFVIYNQMYAIWEQQLAAPTKERLTQVQDLAKSEAMKTAQANLHDDIIKACPNLKNAGF